MPRMASFATAVSLTLLNLWVAQARLIGGLQVDVDVGAPSQPNPPNWPASVVVFKDTDTDIEAKVQAAFATNGGHSPPNHGQFSSSRFAFLFMPGTYTTDVPVGFYTHVVGLGASPDDTSFTGDMGVYAEEGDYVYDGGALCTFWRGAENFHTASQHKWATGTGMLWAVSQAAPLTRVHVDGQLVLYEYQPPYGAAGYASGGYLSNSKIDGITTSGSQQQWYTRNTNLAGWNGGVWNMVYTGCPGAPASHCSNQNGNPYVTVPTTPLIAEKPFMTADPTTGKFSLNIPNVRTASSGPDWSTGTTVDFSQVYVANNVTDTASTINAALASGLHVVLTGGLYSLTESLQVTQPNTVLLGVGYPTLISASGNPVITVGNVDGVRLAGPILLQAGPNPTKVLLQWGDGTYAGSASSPGIMYSVFARVGGPDSFPVQAERMVAIDSGYVIIDGTWLWRADHTVDGIVKNLDNPAHHGLTVTGDNVFAYGLAVEHTTQDLVQWSGNNGETHFYQSEMPYDVTQAQWGTPGYVGYRVNETVTSHKAYGIGVYSFFRDYNVTVNSGIVAPDSLTPSFTSPLAVFLNGKGTQNHVINELGDATGWQSQPGQAYVCASDE